MDDVATLAGRTLGQGQRHGPNQHSNRKLRTEAQWGDCYTAEILSNVKLDAMVVFPCKARETQRAGELEVSKVIWDS